MKRCHSLIVSSFGAALLLAGTDTLAQNVKSVGSSVNWEAAAMAAKSDSGITDADKFKGLTRIQRDVDKLDKKMKAPKGKPGDLKSLLQVNATTAKVIPYVASAGVPVLLPFEVNRLANDLLAGPSSAKSSTASYLGGLRLKEFRPDKNGYYAELLTPSGRGMTIQASSAFASLDGSSVDANQPTAPEFSRNEYAREAEFSRYGVAYKISLNCVPMKTQDSVCNDDTFLKDTVSKLKVIGGVPTP